MIYVIATSHIKPEHRDKFLQILKANVPLVLAEEGCIFYEPCLDNTEIDRETNPDAVTIVEAWQSIEHLKAHYEAPHMKTFVEAVKDLRLSSSVKIVEPA